MSKRTYLNTSDGMASYAKRHGAKFDPETGQYYVDGEIPRELHNLLPRERKPKENHSPPSCPRCGFHMVERYSKTGKAFWGCSQYAKTRCKGGRGFEDDLPISGPMAQHAFSYLSGQPMDDPRESSFEKQELKKEQERIVVLAAEILRNPKRVPKWLTTPKVGLRGKTPTQIMGTIEGCVAVESLLLSIEEADK